MSLGLITFTAAYAASVSREALRQAVADRFGDDAGFGSEEDHDVDGVWYTVATERACFSGRFAADVSADRWCPAGLLSLTVFSPTQELVAERLPQEPDRFAWRALRDLQRESFRPGACVPNLELSAAADFDRLPGAPPAETTWRGLFRLQDYGLADNAAAEGFLTAGARALRYQEYFLPGDNGMPVSVAGRLRGLTAR